MRKFLCFISLLAISDIGVAQIGRRIGSVQYHHATVGTTAQDAIASGSVAISTKGFLICHDAGSASDYLAVSAGADPDTDGIRIAAGACYECRDCGSSVLIEANVKGSAAATGYSVLQFK